MRKKLTAKTVETLAPQGPKRLEVYDITLPGFGLRISPNGHKSWFCAVRDDGRQRRFTLGPYPRLSLADARDAARKTMSDAKQGLLVAPSPTLGETELNFVHAYVGAPNRALDNAERSVEIGYLNANAARSLWSPLNAPVRKTERFKAFARKAGLVDYWRERGWPDLCRPRGTDDFVCD